MSQNRIALRNAGVVEELVVLTRQGHGWGGKTLRETQKQTIAFFDQHLKPSGTEKEALTSRAQKPPTGLFRC